MGKKIEELPKNIAALYPFKTKQLKLSCGFEMNYVDEGEGQPVIMVHGNPTWSFYYRNVIQKLRRNFRCIAVDHIGCGLSDQPTSGYPFTLDQRIKDLGELIDSLKLKSFDMVVHDWGGPIGIGAALERFKKLHRLVILNTAAFIDRRIPGSIALCKTPLFGKLLVQGLNAFVKSAMTSTVKKGKLPSDVRDGLGYPYRSWSKRTAVYQFVKDIPMHASHPSFNRLIKVEDNILKLRDIPVTLLWGGKDFCFNDHFLERWKRFLPNATSIRYPDAGHYILEDEKERVPDAIEQFVSFDDD